MRAERARPARRTSKRGSGIERERPIELPVLQC
jgi:hypothetical protein